MARVVAYVPDLLFGSNVLSQLSAAGHEVVLVSDRQSLDRAVHGAEAIVVDLTVDARERIADVRARRPDRVKVLAFYSHVESEVREAAGAAGFERVIPRSRMAREGASVLDGLLAAQR